MELDRLIASRCRAGATSIARSPATRDCTGEDRRLAAIGKKLGVDGSSRDGRPAGDNYVLTIKRSTSRYPSRRSDPERPLRGQPDDLTLKACASRRSPLAPDQLHGAIQVQTDLIGARVA
jgi:hypothetical protein